VPGRPEADLAGDAGEDGRRGGAGVDSLGRICGTLPVVGSLPGSAGGGGDLAAWISPDVGSYFLLLLLGGRRGQG
jgi:hypothetical protein